jgi:O-acetylhomoserine (thiol)-lyase
MTNDWKFETRQIHAGAAPDPVTNARATPIYKTTSYVFNSAEHAKNLFALAEFGNIYSRIQNPTQAVVEERIAALEGGTGALLLASGQAASTYAVLNIAQAGDHIVSSSSIYGGTYNLFKYTLAKLGIETTFVEDQDDPDEWRRAIRPNTKLFFAETIGNPRINLLDISLVADVAHESGVPLIVDNTIATPYLIRPFEYGADIVVHSATKFLGGHGVVIGGVIVDGGKFEWSTHAEKFPGLTSPDPSYHGAVYTQAVGDGLAYIIKARVQLLRDLGAAIAADSAFTLLQGIETLSLRIERHVQNAQEVAEWLENHPDVTSVNYAGLPSSPWYAAANRYAPKGVGAVVSFELKGGVDDALPADARAAAHERRHARTRAPLRRPREHRRPPRRSRVGSRRGARPLGRRGVTLPPRTARSPSPRPRRGRGPGGSAFPVRNTGTAGGFAPSY